MNKLLLILLTAVMLLGFAQTSQAVMTAVGPTNPATGDFPVWYQDAVPTQLELCLSKTAGPNGPMCVLLADPAFDPALPVIFPYNWPSEAFYFVADARTNVGAGTDRLTYRAAVEAAFGTGTVSPGAQITFSRVRVIVDLPAGSPINCNYTFTHPYGVESIPVTTTGKRAITFTRDVGVGAPGVFTGALAGDVGPFLVASTGPIVITDPVTLASETFIGDPNILQTVTGSPLPFATNFVELKNCNGAIVATTNQFNLGGKVFGGILPPPLTIDRATYARDAAGTQVDVFSASASGAVLTFRDAIDPAAATTVPMTAGPVVGATQTFFGQSTPLAPPAIVVVDAVLTTGTTTSATPLASQVTDVVKITKATYTLDTKKLIIEAFSSDELAIPTLTASGWGPLSVTTPGSTTQSLVLLPVVEPPAFVTVASSAGGSDTAPVKVLPTLNLPPVANNDTSTVAGCTVGPCSAVIIPVLANDTDPDGNLPLSVDNFTQGTNGVVTAVTDPVTLKVTALIYNPNAGFTGTDTFTYQAADALGALSNVATVTVAVVTPNASPVASPDTATTSAGAAVIIPVLSNDSDPDGNLPLVVASVTQGTNGSVVNNGTTVTYTPNPGFPAAPAISATDTFTYVARDTLGALSNVATVTVTVTRVNAAPVAANDAATTNQGVAVTIGVLANDTDADGPLPLTVANLTQPLPAGAGTVAVNANQTVTFTPAAAFLGTATFTYQATDNLHALSNVATVTVTVRARPLAADDAALTNQNTPVIINVVANDTVPGGASAIVPGSIAIVTPAARGTLSVNNPVAGSIRYTPNGNLAGTDSFTYTVTDTLGQVSNVATVTITVNPAPIANPDTVTTARFTTVTIDVLANDTDPAPSNLPLAVASITQPAAGRGRVVNNGTSVTYSPPLLFTGIATFTYVARDALGALSSPATVTVIVGANITVSSAQYATRAASWTIRGNVTRVGIPTTVTLELLRGGVVVGTIATVNVPANNSSYQFRGATPGLVPAAGDVVRATSSLGVSAQRAVAIRR